MSWLFYVFLSVSTGNGAEGKAPAGTTTIWIFELHRNVCSAFCAVALSQLPCAH